MLGTHTAGARRRSALAQRPWHDAGSPICPSWLRRNERASLGIELELGAIRVADHEQVIADLGDREPTALARWATKVCVASVSGSRCDPSPTPERRITMRAPRPPKSGCSPAHTWTNVMASIHPAHSLEGVKTPPRCRRVGVREQPNLWGRIRLNHGGASGIGRLVRARRARPVDSRGALNRRFLRWHRRRWDKRAGAEVTSTNTIAAVPAATRRPICHLARRRPAVPPGLYSRMTRGGDDSGTQSVLARRQRSRATCPVTIPRLCALAASDSLSTATGFSRLRA